MKKALVIFFNMFFIIPLFSATATAYDQNTPACNDNSNPDTECMEKSPTIKNGNVCENIYMWGGQYGSKKNSVGEKIMVWIADTSTPTASPSIPPLPPKVVPTKLLPEAVAAIADFCKKYPSIADCIKSFIECVNQKSVTECLVPPEVPSPETKSSQSKLQITPVNPDIPLKQASVSVKPSIVQLDINGSSDPNQPFSPGEEIILGAHVFNDILNPNNGCPIIELTGKVAENNIKLIACKPEPIKTPSNPGTYTFSADFQGKDSLGSGSSSITFIISDSPVIDTNMIAHINGDTEINLSTDSKTVNIGGRAYIGTDPLNCLLYGISLRFAKIENESGNEINQEIFKKDNLPNCQSLPAELQGAGKYQLTAQFAGKSVYKPAESKAILTVSKGSLIPTQTDLQVTSTQLSTSPDITACTTPKNNPGNTFLIAANHITITKVYKNSQTEIIPIDQPNCSPLRISIDNLSDLDRIEISAKFQADIDSPYASSTAKDITLTNSAYRSVSETPTVKLSSFPSPVNPSDTQVSITASTNQVVTNPVFKVTVNSNTNDISPEESSQNCSDGSGTCDYKLTLSDLYGNYQVQFCAANNVCDSISFTSKTVVGASILFEGSETELPANGSPIQFHLSGQSNEAKTHIFLVKTLYLDGTSDTKNLAVNYEPAQETQASCEDSDFTQFVGCQPDTCGVDRMQCPATGEIRAIPNAGGDCANPERNERCRQEQPQPAQGTQAPCSKDSDFEFAGCKPDTCGWDLFRCKTNPDKIIDKENPGGDCANPERNERCRSKCDDIYYPDPNAETGCAHKFSNDPYPTCNYFAPPRESYVVDPSFCQQ